MSRLSVWILAVALLTVSGAAVAAVATTSFSAGPAGPNPKAVTVADADGGRVITVKLAALGKGVRILRARLRAQRGALKDPRDLLTRIEIYAGDRAAGKPLALVSPWYDAFDVTAAVARAAGAGRELKLFAKTFPAWQAERTRLDVMYVRPSGQAAGGGKPVAIPSAVTGLKVHHRAGQTFITWREVDPLIAAESATWGQIKAKLAGADDACSYQIYAHSKPIDAESFAAAELLAEVQPLSGWNLNGRNMEYLIGQAMIQPDEMGELCRGYGNHMYTSGPNHPRMDRYPVARFVVDERAGPLPPGTGLYVHHPAAAGRRYYAVVSCRAGVANTVDFGAGNSLAKPVDEAVGQGEPVRQGPGLWGPYFDYPGRRQVYVQWTAPPLCPRPSMYFNWSVLVPPGLKAKAPVELYFHSGNFSYAKPRKKLLRGSIQIAPHDFPASGWYGFNDAYGTLRSYRDGTVSNHTQRRIVAFLEWATKVFPVDPDRILLPGGDGAALLALNYPDRFAYAIVLGFSATVLDPKARGDCEVAWGPADASVKDHRGRADWQWAMLDKLVLAQPKRDLPLFSCRSKSWGLHERKFGRGEGRFFDAMRKTHQPIIANWSWGGGAPLTPDRHSGLWRGLDLTRSTPVPALANCSADGNRDGNGNTNGWTTWEAPKETDRSFEITLAGRGTTDMTPRRCRRFRPAPGEKLRWEATPLPDPRRRGQVKPQSGEVTADANGLVTLKGLKLDRTGVRVRITRAK